MQIKKQPPALQSHPSQQPYLSNKCKKIIRSQRSGTKRNHRLHHHFPAFSYHHLIWITLREEHEYRVSSILFYMYETTNQLHNKAVMMVKTKIINLKVRQTQKSGQYTTKLIVHSDPHCYQSYNVIRLWVKEYSGRRLILRESLLPEFSGNFVFLDFRNQNFAFCVR